MRKPSLEMRDWLWSAITQILPVPRFRSASYAAQLEQENIELQRRISLVESAISNVTDESIAREIALHARDKAALEEARQTSVVSRAQALFFAVALVGSLMALGTSFLAGSSTAPRKAVICAGILGICVAIQTAFMLINTIKAVSGISYPRTGSSEITEWATKPSLRSYHKAEAIKVLRLYRTASFLNDWRFTCLTRALTALRNIAILVCLLVIGLFWIAIDQPGQAHPQGDNGGFSVAMELPRTRPSECECIFSLANKSMDHFLMFPADFCERISIWQETTR